MLKQFGAKYFNIFARIKHSLVLPLQVYSYLPVQITVAGLTRFFRLVVNS